ncbi:glycosyltransferase [Cellulomonas humilata]|uniref:Glycosyltransferase n=1 Tax=Cellulomonas humilata TaxID=144055 RepID=A0A7Y6A190_9CELL|nr:glycosyltransferase [Cellulomonas humilata]NUU16802.1 glycosyltransferase [Cellulomonas humilata]
MTVVHGVLVSTAGTAAQARATVASLLSVAPSAAAHVLDVDGTYVPVGDERVLRPADVGIDDGELHRLVVRAEPAELVDQLRPLAARAVARAAGSDKVLLAVAAGVVLLAAPTELVEQAATHGVALVPRTDAPVPHDGRHPDAAELAAAGAYDSALIAVRGDRGELLDAWAAATRPDGGGSAWLDLVAATTPHGTVHGPSTLVSAGSLRPAHVVAERPDGGLSLDGRPVVAVDLSRVDAHAPWLLDVAATEDPRARLSEHPVLAGWVAAQAMTIAAAPVGAGDWDPTTTVLGLAVDAPLRQLYRAAGPDAPDPFAADGSDALLTWLTRSPPDGGPGRYLQALRSVRPDLVQTFPRVPGPDTTGYVDWVVAHAAGEGYPQELLDAAVQAARVARPVTGRPEPGVNVVGFLRGELGIGESARLMVSALRAAGVPYTERSVDLHLASRQRAGVGTEVEPARPGRFDTSILCVNADLTPSIAATVPELLDRTYRIGMWYWEVEEFPASQHGGFAAVDEVWVATDFVQRAIAPHAPVPVRTITPPLPQRRPLPADVTRASLGLPDGVLFLFVFDYLSTFERKNPLGPVEAFTRAFAPGEGPALVLKSINAGRRPAQAEQLRLAVAGRPDIHLLEDYLDADARDALVSLCDCYVSLHRAEGLGLTLAEAMAYGKPVVATAYSGNLQFMTDENSFLVPWTPVRIPPGAEPYPAGSTWAEPDLDAAAALLRRVVDEPEVAAERGARAAQDIATRHSASVSGASVAARLTELAAARRRRSRAHPLAGAQSFARRLAGRLR